MTDAKARKGEPILTENTSSREVSRGGASVSEERREREGGTGSG